ncbi:DUF1003 domain-containing protein [Streptomyces sp. DSM 42041]|uniref:DUF1003 domain-containing protein n=1 Tax=Streptomyces hazeniae TaxID=3075538 RepID=A0ABU2NM01_9ACTN|nr:DUF1003 domain-containing protein [Streptomyces sp. DSM 42041]MDT0378000.1 DUF1003 domain-containing protein [Streptomyces sp. DSM 42041]
MAERDEQRPSRAGAGAAAAGTGTRVRLDQPRVPRRSLLPEYDPDAFGRLSEKIARFLGTGRFIVWMTAVVILWIGWNVVMPPAVRFDEYPFILLTLALSLQASYAAPLILLAQNRQDDRDRVNLEQDRKRNDRSIADTEFLSREVASLRLGLGEVATRDWIRSELQDVVKELQHTNGHGPAPDAPPHDGHGYEHPGEHRRAGRGREGDGREPHGRDRRTDPEPGAQRGPRRRRGDQDR